VIERYALTTTLGIHQASNCRDGHVRRQLSTVLEFQPPPASATQAESTRINHPGTSPPTMPIG
jgi:hypothetical protein